MRTTLIDMQII